MPKTTGTSVGGDDLPEFLTSLLTAAQSFEDDLELLSGDITSAHAYCENAFVVIELINRLGGLGLELPEFTGDEVTDIKKMNVLIQQIKEESIKALEKCGSEKDKVFIDRLNSRSSCYEFSENDYERIQQLINELRVIVSKARAIDDDHRSRILKRLEKLQSELHKTVSDLDKFWGFMGEAGSALGKFGEDSKPFWDRIREMMRILKETQARGPKSIMKDKEYRLSNTDPSDDES